MDIIEARKTLEGYVNREELEMPLTSLLPRPKPLITSPLSFSGNGGSGTSGPAIGSRGPPDRMVGDEGRATGADRLRNDGLSGSLWL